MRRRRGQTRTASPVPVMGARGGRASSSVADALSQAILVESDDGDDGTAAPRPTETEETARLFRNDDVYEFVHPSYRR